MSPHLLTNHSFSLPLAYPSSPTEQQKGERVNCSVGSGDLCNAWSHVEIISGIQCICVCNWVTFSQENVLSSQEDANEANLPIFVYVCNGYMPIIQIQECSPINSEQRGEFGKSSFTQPIIHRCGIVVYPLASLCSLSSPTLSLSHTLSLSRWRPVVRMDPTGMEDVRLPPPLTNSSSTKITNEGLYPSLSPEVRVSLATAFGRCLAFIHSFIHSLTVN